MPRYPRIVAPELFYHIFNRGIEKRAIFRSSKDYQRFLNYLNFYKYKFDWTIYCYCLMPNHFHLLIQQHKDQIGHIMKSLQTAYGVFFNLKYQRVGPLFSGRYRSIIVQEGEYFLQVSKYIHLNPVKTSLCSKPLDYPYSSYREYIKGENNNLTVPLIDKRSMKRILGVALSPQAIKMYQEFVEEKEDLFNYDVEKRTFDIFGNRRFTTKMKRTS